MLGHVGFPFGKPRTAVLGFDDFVDMGVHPVAPAEKYAIRDILRGFHSLEIRSNDSRNAFGIVRNTLVLNRSKSCKFLYKYF